MLHKLIAVSMIISIVVGLMIMQFTTPATIHPLGLLVFFVCLYVLMLGALTQILYIGSQFMQRHSKRRHNSISVWRSYQFASVLALVPVMLIAMRTVGAVTLLDVVFIGLFATVAVFYIARRG